jgi:hypothetical protein
MPAKKVELEYMLRIVPHIDERHGTEGHLFELTTVKEFRTYKYDILVDVSTGDDTIEFVIQGISTPRLSIPEHGSAVFQHVISNLRGTYTIVVSKTTGPKSTFTVHFTPKKTVQKGRTRKSFISLETTHKE